MMVGEVEVKERPRPSPDYLMQLLNEKKLMTSLPNLCGIFTHLERLLDEGKLRWEKWERDHGVARCRYLVSGCVPQRRSLTAILPARRNVQLVARTMGTEVPPLGGGLHRDYLSPPNFFTKRGAA
ncbi:hypothetical protein GOODEAATRI_015894 [Goodea atripinnis]|uniref:STAR protein homodimerisation region domain-containing protein n=1 Tax=Goodea atripinnis TaxID=208336 RepID=A0ABV0MIB5_9TELE